jgi:hypothetical protein
LPKAMQKRKWMVAPLIVAVLLAVAVYAYRHANSSKNDPRNEVLSLLPPDSDAVIYIDLANLRNSVFLKELLAWAPKPAEDPEYAQFVNETGFAYERDLDQVAIAVKNEKSAQQFFAVAKGRFDQKKITAFVEHTGTKETQGKREIFHVPFSGNNAGISFAFLGRDRIALTSRADLAQFIGQPNSTVDSAPWRERFDRLAGSPIFAVFRQDALADEALAEKAPGGLSSPQLASLLSQLEWITIAGKPDGPQMQIVAEGETPDSLLAMQLSDFLKGLQLLAEAGLNVAKVQGRLDTQTREAYQQVLESVDISRIDRGETKSVRAVIEISPKIFEAVRTVPPEAAREPQQQDQKESKAPKRSAHKLPVPAH